MKVPSLSSTLILTASFSPSVYFPVIYRPHHRHRRNFPMELIRMMKWIHQRQIFPMDIRATIVTKRKKFVRFASSDNGKTNRRVFRLESKKVHLHVLVRDRCWDPKSVIVVPIAVHLRNIDAGELEIVQFGLSFGKITNVLNLRKKNQVEIDERRDFIPFFLQAFLQFDSIEHAQAMTDYFSSLPILLNGRQIFVQFSNHQELKTDPNNANNQQAQAALQSATLLQDLAQTGRTELCFTCRD